MSAKARTAWEILDRLGSIVIAAAAVIVAVAAITRERPQSGSNPMILTVERIERWSEVQAMAVPLTKGGEIVVAQFGDFECPFCRQFSRSMQALPESTRAVISESFVNFPLASHQFAAAAAVELECAAQFGQARAVHDRLFQSPESLSKVGPRMVLEAIGLGVAGDHRACVVSDAALQRVDSSVALGRELGVSATPTVVIDGWRLSRPPNPRELDSLIHVLRGRR